MLKESSGLVKVKYILYNSEKKKLKRIKKRTYIFYVSSFWCIPACITFTSFNDIRSEIDRKRMNIPQIAIKYYTIMSLQKNCMPRANRYFYAQINKNIMSLQSVDYSKGAVMNYIEARRFSCSL